MNKAAFTYVEINKKQYLSYIVLDERRDIVDFEIYEDSNDTLLDNIYTGKVENIVKNINSAFVKISDSQNCYLSLNNNSSFIYSNKPSKKECLCIGDEILVQVIKDAVKTKDPVVSSKLSIHGKYCLVTTDNISLGTSKKLPDKLREELVDELKLRYSDESRCFGVVIRTNAKDVSVDEVLADVDATVEKLSQIIARGKTSVYGSKIFTNIEAYIKKAKSINPREVEEIITDIPEIYEKLDQEKLSLCPIRLYKDEQVSLSTLYNLKGQIDKLLNKKVNLRSGANIIIEQLETMTVIDVNTAKNISKKADVVLSVNKEAAKEIGRQLRLRNISGMIIVDFINMNDSFQDELYKYIKELLKEDSVSCELIDVTKLGLFEITRKKVRKSLMDIISKKC